MTIVRPLLGSPLSHSVILLAVFGLANVSNAQFAEEVRKDGAFSYWSLNDSGPGAAFNVATDSETANYPDNAQVEFGVPGLADANTTAVRFKGYDEDTDTAGFLNIANSQASNAGGPWTQKTIEVWFSVDDADSSAEQVIYEQGGSTRAMSIYVRDGQIFAGAHNSNSDAGGVASPWPAGTIGAGESELAFVSTEIESNTPYYLAMVFDGASEFNEDLELDGTITGYLNGEEFGQIDGIGTLYAHTDAIRVGGPSAQTHFDPDFSGTTAFGNDGPAFGGNAPYFFRGVVDDLALYNVALTGEQIAAHYDSREYVYGDFDGDGTVAFGDFLKLADGFNQPGGYSDGDISFDGQVNLVDYSIFREILWGAPAAAAVPEPSSSLLILLPAILLPMFRRSRTR